MTTRMAKTMLFVACLCAGPALAQAGMRLEAGDARALHEYRSTTQHALVACGSAFAPRQAWARATAPNADYRACVGKARAEVAVKLDQAVRTVQADCVLALRKYNAAFEKALLGIEPLQGESPLAYEQRQVSLFHAMAHAWGRFEIAESFAP